MAKPTPRRVAIYARVSTDDRKPKEKRQDPENQLRQLRDWCERSGHTVTEEYVERESGRKGTADRKELSQLLTDAHKREFDLVLFWSLDRFSREGMAKTVSYLERLNRAGVAFHSYTEEMLSTDNELVRDILIAVMASLAKQEAIKISERTKAGLERARAQGKRLGQAPASAVTLKKIRALQRNEPWLSERKLAERVGVSRTVVRKALKTVKITAT